MSRFVDPELDPEYAATTLIDGSTWASVDAYVKSGGDLHKGMLQRFAQNLHLQPKIRDQLSHQAQTSAAPAGLFEWLWGQFRPMQDAEIANMLPGVASHVLPSAVATFKRCQPFVGTTRGVALANMHGHRLSMGATYADDVERLLNVFVLDP